MGNALYEGFFLGNATLKVPCCMLRHSPHGVEKNGWGRVKGGDEAYGRSHVARGGGFVGQWGNRISAGVGLPELAKEVAPLAQGSPPKARLDGYAAVTPSQVTRATSFASQRCEGFCDFGGLLEEEVLYLPWESVTEPSRGSGPATAAAIAARISTRPAISTFWWMPSHLASNTIHGNSK